MPWIDAAGNVRRDGERRPNGGATGTTDRVAGDGVASLWWGAAGLLLVVVPNLLSPFRQLLARDGNALPLAPEEKSLWEAVAEMEEGAMGFMRRYGEGHQAYSERLSSSAGRSWVRDLQSLDQHERGADVEGMDIEATRCSSTAYALTKFACGANVSESLEFFGLPISLSSLELFHDAADDATRAVFQVGIHAEGRPELGHVFVVEQFGKEWWHLQSFIGIYTLGQWMDFSGREQPRSSPRDLISALETVQKGGHDGAEAYSSLFWAPNTLFDSDYHETQLPFPSSMQVDVTFQCFRGSAPPPVEFETSEGEDDDMESSGDFDDPSSLF